MLYSYLLNTHDRFVYFWTLGFTCVKNKQKFKLKFKKHPKTVFVCVPKKLNFSYTVILKDMLLFLIEELFRNTTNDKKQKRHAFH